MQLSHVDPVRSAVFDDPNLVSFAGLVPVVALAHRAGLGQLARLFEGVRAPSTLGTFLRAFRFGHVRQLDAVAARFVAGLARHAPIIATNAPITYLDIDDTVRATFGYSKQGAGYGYSGVKGLNALLAIVSTPSSAPVIVATRLRKGSANSARGASRLVADAIKTSRAAGAAATMVLRADSTYYGSEVIAAARRHGTRFLITARKDKAITASIGEDAWTAIHYPQAVFDEQLQQWVPDAEVAAVHCVHLEAENPADHGAVDRAPGPGPEPRPRCTQRPSWLFQVWRHHAVFTDSPLPTLAAERDHRRHAIVEQVIADLKSGPLAHPPSGHFAANSAWLDLAAMAFNLTRAAGTLASSFHAKATTATVRRSWSASQPESPDQLADPPCGCPPRGPGPPPGNNCSPPRPDHQPEPEPPLTARPDRRTTVETSSRSTTRPHPPSEQHQRRSTSHDRQTTRWIWAKRMEPEIQGHIDALLDAVPDPHQVDLIEHFALPGSISATAPLRQAAGDREEPFSGQSPLPCRCTS